jgi:hypothetical protein
MRKVSCSTTTYTYAGVRYANPYNSNMTRNILNGVVILAIIFFGLTFAVGGLR